MPKAMNFVDINYTFFENFNGYVFYKKKIIINFNNSL
jgi:hypothetical protein